MGYPFVASGSVWVWEVFADAGDGLVGETGVEGAVPVAFADVGAAVAWTDDYCW